MQTSSHQELQRVYRAAQRSSLAQGRRPGHAADAAVEAQLTRLLGLTIGMFGIAMASIIGVGYWIG